MDDECKECGETVKKAKQAKRLSGVNEIDYEVHANGVRVRIRIVSHDNTTREVTAKALVLVKKAMEMKRSEYRVEIA